MFYSWTNTSQHPAVPWIQPESINSPAVTQQTGLGTAVARNPRENTQSIPGSPPAPGAGLVLPREALPAWGHLRVPMPCPSGPSGAAPALPQVKFSGFLLPAQGRGVCVFGRRKLGVVDKLGMEYNWEIEKNCVPQSIMMLCLRYAQ